MAVAAPARRFTADDFYEMPDKERLELVHGYPVERTMSPISAWVALQIARRFGDFVSRNPTSAFAFGDGLDFRLSDLEDNETVRKPDAAIVLRSRVPGGRLPDKRFDFSPDLAVEVISPSDIAYDIETKIQDYLDAGTQVVWLANPVSKRISVYRPDGSVMTFGPNDTITADPVLPGFTMRVREVFPEV
jgi:Uma2 family endonuclease